MLEEYKKKEFYGLYWSSSEFVVSLKDSKESMLVVSFFEKFLWYFVLIGVVVMIKILKLFKV